MALIQEKMWIEIPQHPMLLRKYVLFFWASTFLWQFMVCFWMDFLCLDVRLSQQLPLRVITLCQKNGPVSLSSIQHPITFDSFPILLFRLSPFSFLSVAWLSF